MAAGNITRVSVFESVIHFQVLAAVWLLGT